MFEADCIDSVERLVEYGNAFSQVWDNELSSLSNRIEDISQNLERAFILRRFNREALKMETRTGSPLNKLIGMGSRVDESGSSQPIVNFYRSPYKDVLDAFKRFPIAEYFGLTVKDAMELPADQWNQLLKSARDLPIKSNNDESQLMQLLKELILSRRMQEE